MKASKSLSSYLTCNLVPRRDAGQYVDAPQPQTATCCTVLYRAGFVSEGGAAPTTHPRFAPLRTPGSAAMLVDDSIDEEEEEEEGQQQQQITPSSAGRKKKTTMIRKMVRKCKSSVADVDMAQMTETEVDATPRLRRSGAVRRDWSFEDLRGAAHKAA